MCPYLYDIPCSYTLKHLQDANLRAMLSFLTPLAVTSSSDAQVGCSHISYIQLYCLYSSSSRRGTNADREQANLECET